MIRTLRNSRTPRAAVLGLLLLALLAGSVELHTDAAGHGAAVTALAGSAGAGDGPLYVCAEGHAPGSHVERPRVAEPHDCAACLHRLQVRGGDLLPVGLPADGAHGGASPAEQARVAAAPVLDHAPSRGPPTA